VLFADAGKGELSKPLLNKDLNISVAIIEDCMAGFVSVNFASFSASGLKQVFTVMN
jgi:hypothetical protein